MFFRLFISMAQQNSFITQWMWAFLLRFQSKNEDCWCCCSRHPMWYAMHFHFVAMKISAFVPYLSASPSLLSLAHPLVTPGSLQVNQPATEQEIDKYKKKHSMTSFAMAKWAHCIRITVSLNKRYLHSSTEFHTCHDNNNNNSSRKENNNKSIISSRNGNNKQKIFIRYIFASRNCSTVLNADSVWEANELKASSTEIFGREEKINHLTSFHMHCSFDSCRCRWVCVCVFVCFASFPLYSRFCRSLVLREIDTLAIFFCFAQLHHFLKRNSVIWDIHEFQMTTFERGYEFDKRQFSFIHLFHGAMNV